MPDVNYVSPRAAYLICLWWIYLPYPPCPLISPKTYKNKGVIQGCKPGRGG